MAVVVIAKSPCLVIDDVLQLRQLFLHGQDFVDLLLVLHHRNRDVGMVEHIGQFGRDRVGIERHRNGAQSLRRQDRLIQTRPIVARNRDRVAALDAKFRQAERDCAHLAQQVRPAPGLPDTDILMPQCGTIAPHLRMMHQKLRKCILSSVQRCSQMFSLRIHRIARAGDGRRLPAFSRLQR